MNREERIQKINEIEKVLKVTEDLRTEAITKKKMYEEQLAKTENALKELGTTPEEAEKKIEELKKEIEEGIKAINEALPVELLKKWGRI